MLNDRHLSNLKQPGTARAAAAEIADLINTHKLNLKYLIDRKWRPALLLGLQGPVVQGAALYILAAAASHSRDGFKELLACLPTLLEAGSNSYSRSNSNHALTGTGADTSSSVAGGGRTEWGVTASVSLILWRMAASDDCRLLLAAQPAAVKLLTGWLGADYMPVQAAATAALLHLIQVPAGRALLLSSASIASASGSPTGAAGPRPAATLVFHLPGLLTAAMATMQRNGMDQPVAAGSEEQLPQLGATTTWEHALRMHAAGLLAVVAGSQPELLRSLPAADAPALPDLLLEAMIAQAPAAPSTGLAGTQAEAQQAGFDPQPADAHKAVAAACGSTLAILLHSPAGLGRLTHPASSQAGSASVVALEEQLHQQQQEVWLTAWSTLCHRLCSMGSEQAGRLLGSPPMAALLLDVLAGAAAASPPCNRRLSRGSSVRKGGHGGKADSTGLPTTPSADVVTAVGIHVLALLRHMCYWPHLAMQLAQLNRGELLPLLKPYLLAGPGKPPVSDAAAEAEGSSSQSEVFTASAAALAAAVMRPCSGTRPSAVAGLLAAASEALPEWLGLLVAGRAGATGPASWQRAAFCWLAVCADVATADEGPLATAAKALTRLRGAVGALISCLGDSLERLAARGRGEACSLVLQQQQLEQRDLLAGVVACCKLLEVAAATAGLTAILVTRTNLTTTLLDLALAAAAAAAGDSPPAGGSSSGLQPSHVAGCAALLLAVLCQGCSTAVAAKALVSQPQCIPTLQALVALPDCWGPCAALLGALIKLPGCKEALASSGVSALLNHLLLDKLGTSTGSLRSRVAAGVCEPGPVSGRPSAVAAVFDGAGCPGGGALLLAAAGTDGLDGAHGWTADALMVVLSALPALSNPSTGCLDTSSRDGSSQLLAALLEVCDSVAGAAGLQAPGGVQQQVDTSGQQSAEGTRAASARQAMPVAMGLVPGIVSWWGSSHSTRNAAQLLLASLTAMKQLGGLPRQQLLQQYPHMMRSCQSVLELLLAAPVAGGAATFSPAAEQQQPQVERPAAAQMAGDLACLTGALWQQLMECMSTWAATWAAAKLKPRLSDGQSGTGARAASTGIQQLGPTLQLFMVGTSMGPGAWAVRLAAARGLSAVLTTDPSLVAGHNRHQAQQLLSCLLALAAAPAITCSSASAQGVGGPGGVLHLTTDALALQQQLTAEAEVAALALDSLLALAGHGVLAPMLAASPSGCSCCPLAAISGLVEVLGALLQEDVLVQVNMALRRLAATAARTQGGAAAAGRPAPGPPSREPSMSAAQELRRTVSLGSSTAGGGTVAGEGGSEGSPAPAPAWSTPAAAARLAALDLRAASAQLLLLLLWDQQAWSCHTHSSATHVDEGGAPSCGCSCRCPPAANTSAAEQTAERAGLDVPLSLLQGLEGLLGGGSTSARMTAVQALWCLATLPGGADMLLAPSHGLVPALLAVVRGSGGALRVAALSLLARLAQAATDVALTGLCHADGLCATLVEALSAGLEQLQEPSLQEASVAAQPSEGLLAPGSRAQVSGSQLAGDMAAAALTALAALCRSGSLAARLASTRGLPGALLGALRAGQPPLLSAAAALVAGLTCHKASAGVAGTAPGVARMLLASVKSGAASHDLLPVYGALRNLAAVDASRTEMASDPSVAIVLVAPLAHLPASAISSAAGSAASSFSSAPSGQRGTGRAPAAGSSSNSGGLLQHVMATIGSPLVLLDVQIAAAAALVNLTAEKLGCEALLMEHPRIMPVLAACLAHCQATTSGAGSRPGSRRGSAAGADGLGIALAGGLQERATRPISAGAAPGSSGASGARPRSAGAAPAPAAATASGISGVGTSKSDGIAGGVEAEAEQGELDAAVAGTFLLSSKLWVVLANCCRHAPLCSVLASQQQLMGLLLQQMASIPLPTSDSSSDPMAEGAGKGAGSEAGAAVPSAAPVPVPLDPGAGVPSSQHTALTRGSASWWDMADRAHADVAALRCCQYIVTTCPQKLAAALQQAARGPVDAAASSTAANTSPTKGAARRARTTAAATTSQQAAGKTMCTAAEVLAHAAGLLCWVDVALLADAVASGSLQLDLMVVGRPSAADGEGVEAEVGVAAGHLSAEASASTSEGVSAAAGAHEMWADLAGSAMAVASAAAGLLGLAVSVGWVPPAPSPATLASLTTLLLLPTLPGAAGASPQPTTPGRSSASMGTVWPRLGSTLAASGSEELEAVAGQAAVCSWALASHPAASAPGWPLALSSSGAWCHALLALVRGYQGAGSKVRYHPCRLVPAVILGQVLIAGLLPDALVVQLATPPLVSSLVDACTLATTAAALAGAAAGGSTAGQMFSDQYPGGPDAGGVGAGRASSGNRAVSPGRPRPESGAPPGSPTAAKARAGSPVRRAPGPAATSGMPSSPGAGGISSRDDVGSPAATAPRLLKPSRSMNRQSADPAAAAKLVGLAAVGCSLQLAGVLGLQAATSLAHIAAWAGEQLGGMHSSNPGSGGDNAAWGSSLQDVFIRCCPSLVPTLASLLDSRLPEVLLVGSMALAAVSSLGPMAAAAMAKDGRLLGKVARLLHSCQEDAVAAYLLVVLTNACSQPSAAAQVVRHPALLPSLVAHLSGWVAQPWAGKWGEMGADAGSTTRPAAARAVASPRTLQAAEGVAASGSIVKSTSGMPRGLVAYLPNKQNKKGGAGKAGGGLGRGRGVGEGDTHQHAMARATAAASCLCNLAVADVVLAADGSADGALLLASAPAADGTGAAVAGAAPGVPPPQGVWLLADPLWEAVEGLLGSAADTLMAASQLEVDTADGTPGATGNGGGSEQSEQLVVFLLAMLPMMLGLAANVAAQPSAVVTKVFEARPTAAAMLACLLSAVQEETDRLTLLSTMCRLVAVAGADPAQPQAARLRAVAVPGEVEEQQGQQQICQSQPLLAVDGSKPGTPPLVPSMVLGGSSSMEPAQSFASALGAAVSSASRLLNKWVATEDTSRSVRQAAQWLLRSASS